MGTYTKLLQAEREKPEQEASVKPPVFETSTPPKSKPTKRINNTKKAEPVVSRYHDTTTPRHHDTTVSRYHDTIIEAIRKAVKQIGKEAATHRFTVAEKQEIANIVFTYKNQGVFTSENEVSRVAINFIIADYKENGEESVLARAIKALND
jgi:hypothetical protein